MIDKYDYTKPVRLIELFAGIGAQAKALENLQVDFEHWVVCEFDEDAVRSYNAVHGTNFSTSDVTKMHAEDLNIVNTKDYTYVLTYSFPCQDLSSMGKGRGMEKGSGTRSGLLWEVERLLNECGELPQVLLMENVPLVHSQKNLATFNSWLTFLESKGYKNYWKDLNSKDYGVPQSRNRCFMVSILGGGSYEFPAPVPLEKTLGDLLDKNVESRYYLTEERCARIANWNAQQNPLERVNGSKSICPTLTARGAGEYHSGMVLISPYLTDTADLRGTILQREVCERAIDLTKPYEVIDYTYSNSRLQEIADGRIKVMNKKDPSIMNTLTTNSVNFGIRLPEDAFRVPTPRECWRLMGFSDDDFDRARLVADDKQLYKQAGNSIVVDVLMAVFKNLFTPSEGEEALEEWML